MNLKDKSGFITPANHVDFLAKKLFGDCGSIVDGSVAYIQPGGGGPVEEHVHPHSHLFIVVSGCAHIKMGEKEIVLNENESFLVDGNAPHSVWNDGDREAVMIGVSVIPDNDKVTEHGAKM